MKARIDWEWWKLQVIKGLVPQTVYLRAKRRHERERKCLTQ